MSLQSISSKGSGLPNRYVLHAVEGWGKCLGRGTPVLMFDGTIKPVEDVAEGDLLMGPDSTPRRVAGLHSGVGPLFRVVPTKGEPYVVNGHHVLSLKMSRRHGCDFHEVVNIPLNEYQSKSDAFKRDALGWRTGVEWPSQEVPIDPYLFGCWLGDGTSTKPEITTADEPVAIAIGEYAKSEGMSVVRRAVTGAATTLALSAGRTGGTRENAFTSALKSLGVFANKHIPWVYKANSKESRLELLAGLMDTDGHLYGNCFEIIQKRKELAEDIAFVARSLGFAAYISECSKSCVYLGEVVTGTYYRIKISGPTSQIPTRIQRKIASVRKQIKNVLVTGIKIEPIGSGEFFGFELDGDHLFLLGDFTVTHNTSFGANFPKPIFLQTKGETGLETLIDAGRLPEVAHFPEAQTWVEFMAAIAALRREEHGYKTLVIDTVNGAERMCHEHVVERDFKGEWGDQGFLSYGKGPEIALADWRIFLSALDSLRTEKRMTIVLLCHTKVKPFKNPIGADYDRYQPDMHEKSWGLTHKWADTVLFGNFHTAVVGSGNRELADTSKKGKGLGGKQRVLYTVRDAAYDAKNRLGLPEEIDMGDSAVEAFRQFSEAVKAAKGEAK